MEKGRGIYDNQLPRHLRSPDPISLVIELVGRNVVISYKSKISISLGQADMEMLKESSKELEVVEYRNCVTSFKQWATLRSVSSKSACYRAG